MSEIKQYAALEYVVEVLQKAILGSKVKQLAPDEIAIIDGNAAIGIKQQVERNGSTTSIVIRDKKEILYSEDLLETVYHIHKGATHDAGLKAALLNANIMINGLNIEAELIFHAIRDQFYALGDSYEFLKFIEKDNQQMKFNMTFGDDVVFELIVLNEPTAVTITAISGKAAAPAVKAAIKLDVESVSLEINKQFKAS
ncbi:hypothetical protein IWX76_000421 [Pedobacter sp. CAN_A7]|uniref:hypothetical protein n=1 Tax=Pedobacter sp. CAN_A7 TaxID=2787722 RepID=UPI0018C99F5A